MVLPFLARWGGDSATEIVITIIIIITAILVNCDLNDNDLHYLEEVGECQDRTKEGSREQILQAGSSLTKDIGYDHIWVMDNH